jgi:hypothetical protein
MRNVSAIVLIAAIAFSMAAPSTCRAGAYQPGTAWVYDSPQSLWVVRMVENSNCYFAMFSKEPNFGDAGQCQLLTNGVVIMVDLTFDGAFANGLAITGLKQLRFVYAADRDVLLSMSHTPSIAFVRMSNSAAEKLIAERK